MESQWQTETVLQAQCAPLFIVVHDAFDHTTHLLRVSDILRAESSQNEDIGANLWCKTAGQEVRYYVKETILQLASLIAGKLEWVDDDGEY